MEDGQEQVSLYSGYDFVMTGTRAECEAKAREGDGGNAYWILMHKIRVVGDITKCICQRP